jgi:glycosyltransferase involved in cell wall biosynthesis
VPEILTVNVDYNYTPAWRKDAIHIAKIDKNWHKRSTCNKAWFLASIVKNYKKIIFTYDVRLVSLYYIFSFFHLYAGKKEIIFITLLVDVAQFIGVKKYGFRNTIKYWFYFFFIRIPGKIVVHTKEEIRLYSETFKLYSKNKFYFIPHCFAYHMPDDNDFDYSPIIGKTNYIVCPGNHRDIETFVNAIQMLPSITGIIIGSDGNRAEWEHVKINNIEFKFSIPYEEYRQVIANAKLLVFPVRKVGPLRSLGHITVFHSVIFGVPVLAADSFQLKDYFSRNEIWYYEPGNARSLADTINLVLTEKTLSKLKVERAMQRYKKNYTPEKYLDNLTNLCLI